MTNVTCVTCIQISEFWTHVTCNFFNFMFRVFQSFFLLPIFPTFLRTLFSSCFYNFVLYFTFVLQFFYSFFLSLFHSCHACHRDLTDIFSENQNVCHEYHVGHMGPKFVCMSSMLRLSRDMRDTQFWDFYDNQFACLACHVAHMGPIEKLHVTYKKVNLG